jgi:hypothetical protein
MRQTPWHRRNGRSVAAAVLLSVLAFVPSALAGQPVTQTLTPPAPSWQSCKAVGNGTVCEGTRTESYGPDDTGIVCGSGPAAFDIYDSGTDDVHAVRFYDGNGNLTRRIFTDHYAVGEFSNPLTGVIVPYTQHSTTTDVFAVPGDLSTQTRTFEGENNYTVAGVGAVFLNAGRTVIGPSGNEEFAAGPHSFEAYFGGDISVLQPLCAALGAI